MRLYFFLLKHSLHSLPWTHIRPQNVYTCRFPTAAVYKQFDSRTSRSIAWDFAQLSTLVKLRTYDWSLNSLGNNGSRRRSQNILRGITVGIGPIWGIQYLSFILSWGQTTNVFKISTFSVKKITRKNHCKPIHTKSAWHLCKMWTKKCARDVCEMYTKRLHKLLW